MAQTKLMTVLAALLILAASLIVIRTLWFSGNTSPESIQATLDGMASPAEKVDYLISLAKNGNEGVLPIASQWLASEIDFFHDGAIQVLTYFDDTKTIPAIQASWSKFGEYQQMKTVRVFSTRPSPAAKAFLEDVSLSGTPTALLAEYYLKGSLENITEELPSFEVPTQNRILDTLYVDAKDNTDIIELYSELAEKSKSVQIQQTAIRYLAELNDSGFATHIESWVKSVSPLVRAAAVEAIPKVCPENRWKIIENLAQNENDEMVIRRVLDILSFLKGKTANKVYATIYTRSSKFSKELAQKVDETGEDLKQPNPANRCDKI